MIKSLMLIICCSEFIGHEIICRTDNWEDMEDAQDANLPADSDSEESENGTVVRLGEK